MDACTPARFDYSVLLYIAGIKMRVPVLGGLRYIETLIVWHTDNPRHACAAGVIVLGL